MRCRVLAACILPFLFCPAAPPSEPAPSRPAGPSAPRVARREIPVGLAQVENQILPSRGYVYAIRFVVDKPTRVWRFFSGFNVEGTRRLGGRKTYARGNGGTIRARLVRVDSRGRPRMRSIIASERVNAVRRYLQTKRSYALGPHRSQMIYFNMRGVRLAPNQVYAMTYQNVSRFPRRNYFSTDSPTIKASEAGPNGRNNLNRLAATPVAGLDPREAVAWSRNRGRSWVWGRRVGEGHIVGTYPGSRRSDGGVRLPWYGWQQAPFLGLESNQPYYAYANSGSYTLVNRRAPRAVRLLEAGGYAPRNRRAGVITVVNLRTGVHGETPSLGSGIVRGRLDRPVDIAAGDSYAIRNTGRVFKAEADEFNQRLFGLGADFGLFPFTTYRYEADRAELFALPHPYFEPVR